MSTARIPNEWKNWFPDEMLGLPEPWRDLDVRYKRLASIPLTREELTTALKVLERGFRVLPRLPHPLLEEVLPERLTEFPTVAVSSITLDIPTFDDFRQDPFAQALNIYKHNYPPQHMEQLAQLWVHKEVRGLISRVHNWIIETLHEMRDPELVTSYISLVRSAWRNVSQRGLVPFITDAKSVALHAGIPDAAIPFIDEVLAAPDLDAEQRDWANYLRQQLQAASVANRR